MMLISRFVPSVPSGTALGCGGRRRGRGHRLGLSVHLVRFDDLVFGLGALSAGLGPLDLHLERGALRVRFGARRHAARLVRLLYVGIEVYDEVADADVPLVVIVLEVGGVRVGRPAAAHNIVARSQVGLMRILGGNPIETQSIHHFDAL